MSGIVLIGASTGAPRSHHVYLQNVPAGFCAPIVIVQHMPKGPFVEGMVRYLKNAVRLPVSIAQDADALRAGEVMVIEPGTQLRFAPGGTKVRVSPSVGENFFAPSMDVTFASAAQVFGPKCFAVILSGLHADVDGLEGCTAIRSRGGKVLVTNPQTTACYLMVERVCRAGQFDGEAPLSQVLKVVADWMKD